MIRRPPTVRTPPSRPGRLLAALLLVGVLFTGLPVDTTEARPRGSTYSTEQVRVRQLVNQARSNHRRRNLAMSKTFADRATLWARELARCRCLKHRRAPYGAPRGWYAAAENVGRGRSLARIHRAFMRSSAHRATILNARYTHIGTGVARAANGEIFVVQAFMDRTR